jgi:DNA (cytosine-5)-methyltransferase 1
MREGALATAPIWSDVRTFDSAEWRGTVDVVTAGYPCQGESNAGKRRGTADERWLWDDIWRIVRDVGARYLFVENVAAHVNRSFPKVLASLAESGWAAEWDCVPAAAVGAPHQRDRVFMLAAHTDVDRLQGQRCSGLLDSLGTTRGLYADGCAGAGAASLAQGEGLEGLGQGLPTPEAWAGRPPPEPTICRVDDGLARSVDQDRLYVLGNGVVPQAAEFAFRVLWSRLHTL